MKELVASLITTQYREKYGAHDWDGTGECPQYWKNKGGVDYMICGAPSIMDAENSLISSSVANQTTLTSSSLMLLTVILCTMLMCLST